MEEKITLIASFVTLFSLVVGFYISIKVNILNFKAQVISKNRQEWINKLRNLIAELLSHEIGAQGNAKILEKIMKNIDEKENEISADDNNALNDLQIELYQKIIDSALRRRSLGIEISLMLNPNDKRDNLLISLVELYSLGTDKDAENKKWNEYELRKKIIEITQNVLKSEWERVKSGK